MPQIVRPFQDRTEVWQLPTYETGRQRGRDIAQKTHRTIGRTGPKHSETHDLVCTGVTETGEGVLEQKILEQTAQMEKYSQAVQNIKRNNI